MTVIRNTLGRLYIQAYALILDIPNQGEMIWNIPVTCFSISGVDPFPGVALLLTDQDIFAKLASFKKKAIQNDALFEGAPPEFQSFLKYARGLGFKEEPDYKTWQIKFAGLQCVLGLTGTH